MKLVGELRDKVRKLEKELASANNHIQFLSSVTGQDVPADAQKDEGQISSSSKPKAPQQNNLFDEGDDPNS